MKDNVIGEFWEYLEGEETKISDRVLAYLNRDELGAIISDGNVYWLKYHGNYSAPKYVFKYIKRWMNNKDVEYLFDKYPGRD